MRRPPTLRTAARLRTDDGGFTLIEVLVATTLLIVGALATLALLDNGASATASSKERDVANALAQEMVERSVAGRYTLDRNDMTDVDATAHPSVAGPADRLRLALDPDGDQSSTTVAPITVQSGTTPVAVPQSWQVTRGGTVYEVSYRACTSSDVYQGVRMPGPYDCSRAVTPPGPDDETPVNARCRLGVASSAGVSAGASSPVLELQLLSAFGLSACISVPDEISDAVCTIIGSSPLIDGLNANLLSADGLLGNLLGGLVAADLETCPVAQVATGLTGIYTSTASSTRVAVTISWTSRSGPLQSIERSTVVRRPTA